MSGYIPIRRSLFDHFLFKEPRVYSRFEAWLDLIQLATFQEENTQVIKGRVITCQKGQLVASVRFLEARWQWSKKKVCSYIELLRSQQMLTIDTEDGINRITLSNFRKHNDNSIGDSEGDTNGDSKRRNSKGNKRNMETGNAYSEETPMRHQVDSEETNINKGNKGNKGEEGTANAEATPPMDDELFRNLQTWIEANAPRVAKLKEPFTKDQYIKIRQVYSQKAFTDVLTAMHNKASLLKDYTSAYLTCNNWLARRAKDGENVYNDEPGNIQQPQSKATLIGQQVAGAVRKPD